MKKWIVLLVLLAVGGAALWTWQQGRAVAPPAPAAQTARVTRGEIVQLVEATGSVESNLDVDVKSKASGEVIQLPHDVGDLVPRHVPGQNEAQALLAALDPVDETRRVQRIEAARNAAQAGLEQAQAAKAIATETLRVRTLEVEAEIASAQAKARLDDLTLDRRKELTTRGAGTQNELDAAEAAARMSRANVDLSQARREGLKVLEVTLRQRQAEIDLASANLAAAEAELADARQRLAETKIYSPIDGVVTRRDVQVGQIISSGIINVAGGTTLLTVSDLSRMFVQAEVHESDIGRLIETGKLGQDAEVTADAYPGRRFVGKVVQMTPRGISDARVINFLVKVEVLDEGKSLLRPKMTADVTILAERKKNVLRVPNACLHYEKEKPYVEVRAGAAFEKRHVRLGINDGLQAEVLEGLAEGDEVALGTQRISHWINATTQPEATTRP